MSSFVCLLSVLTNVVVLHSFCFCFCFVLFCFCFQPEQRDKASQERLTKINEGSKDL